jgi:hypothetical protein
LEQNFFEMRDIRLWSAAAWMPLRVCASGRVSFKDEDCPIEVFDGVATLAVPEADRAVVDRFGWSEVSIQHDRSVVDNDGYHAADTYRVHNAEHPVGVRLVIDQYVEEQNLHVWHLHPDLVVALRLVREGDTWFRPEEGWAVVVRLARDPEGRPIRMEIRSEFLADYLAAQTALLFLSSYHERRVEPEQLPAFTWPQANQTVEQGRDSLELRLEKRRGSNWVSGALWRTEWFQPGPLSLRVRGDQDASPTTFALDNQGSRRTPNELHGAQTWLYFRPELALALARHRGFELNWGSEQTGGIGATGNGVHFGLNELGLINIFAKDIAALDPWEQRIWGAHNVPPEGGVSAELFAAQMELRYPETTAPETQVADALTHVDARLSAFVGTPLLRDHNAVPGLLARIHRFRATDHEGVLLLGRDLSKVFTERVDVTPLHRQLGLKAGDRTGSLKSLQQLAAAQKDADAAARLMAPLFGVQDLRGAAAHLGDQLVAGALPKVGVDPDTPTPEQGRALIASFVATLQALGDLFPTPGGG